MDRKRSSFSSTLAENGICQGGRREAEREIRIVFGRKENRNPTGNPTSVFGARTARRVLFTPENQRFLFMGKKRRKNFSFVEMAAEAEHGPDAASPRNPELERIMIRECHNPQCFGVLYCVASIPLVV